MKTTTNVFLDGITTDMHPLTTEKNQLTDALNATLRTFNGNELVLQNDMGNTMIQDSTTGNIMGLRDGFVPVGMKEHGGVLYIASYNQETNEGELGTIPSPVFNYDYNQTPDITDYEVSITNTDIQTESNSLINALLPKYLQQPFQISDSRFQVGDQFIINLTFDNTDIKTQRICKVWNNGLSFETREYPLISGFKEDVSGVITDIPNYGWFRMELEAKVEKSSDTLVLSNITNKKQTYYTEDSLDEQQSKYWFIPTSTEESTELDVERCQASDCYRTYPNILPGYLYVQTKAELPENFEFFVNKSTGIKSPNIFVVIIND